MASSQVSRMVGGSPKRKEDPRLVIGEGEYTDDIQLRGMAYMAVLRNPHGHARIRRIDTSRVQEQPGVLAVLTGDETNARCKQEFPLFGVLDGMRVKSRWPMSSDVARYVGEPVAAVAATSREAARDALELVQVDWEPLPSVVDIEKAVQAGSPLVHEDLGTNVCVESSRVCGDPDRAFREASGVVSLRLEQPRMVPNAMETRAVVASYERGSGNLTLWISSQGAHRERDALAEVLDFPENKMKVIAPDVGGGFGAKIDLYPETIIATLLSMQLAQPVKWIQDRQEDFISTSHGRGEVQYVEAAYQSDGTLTGLRIRYYTDLGAYCNGGSHNVVQNLGTSGPQGTYRVSDIGWTSYGVYTNKVPIGPYRGYGQHATAYFVERVMDLIARELSMDPADVRRKNFIPKEAFPYRSPTGQEYDSGDYEAALDRALETADYDNLREEQVRLRGGPILMGIGIATCVDASGFGPTRGISARPGYESAIVRMDPAGKATVLTGSSPHGEGMETTFAQIVADELELPFEDIEVLHGDTAITPYGLGTRASRSLVVGGTAAIMASRKVKEKATQVAAALLQIDASYVSLEGGRFFAEDIPDRYVSWADVARAAYEARNLPLDMERGLEATAFWEPPAYTFPFSANVATVLVDKDTGEVKLTSYVSVDDCGTPVNPMIVDGQVHGGLAQGIGMALLEEAVWSETGQLVSGSFMDYAMPFAEELPMFILDRTVTPSPNNPLGAKGMGESPTVAAVPAIVNAVADALNHLGVTHVDIPLKSEKVWRSLR